MFTLVVCQALLSNAGQFSCLLLIGFKFFVFSCLVMRFKVLLVSIASLSLVGCGGSSIKGWNQLEKDTLWKGCEMMSESETTDYCDCLVEKISSSMSVEEFEDASMKVLDLGFDANKLPNFGHYISYKQSIRECKRFR